MNLPNFATLCLVATAMTVFLLGLFFPLSAIFRSPAEIIELTGPIIGSSSGNNPALSLTKSFPWLIPTVLFFASTCLASLLAAAGLVIWRLVGRRRILQMQQTASQQATREEALQELLDQHVGRLLKPRGPQPESDFVAIASSLQDLDPERRHRFDSFCREIGPEKSGSPTAFLAAKSDRPPFQQRRTRARALALGLALVGLFGILWAMLPLFFADLIASFYQEAIGIDLEPIDSILAAIFIWILATNPLGISVGLLRLSRLESKLEGEWDEGRDKARDLLLASYRGQLKTLSANVPTSSPDTLAILRGLTQIALPQLEGTGKRPVLELLYEHGFLNKGRRTLDLALMDFSGANLRDVSLREASLRGIDLRRAMLAEADLSRADLSDALLEGSDLRSSNLQGVCLQNADLRFARLQRANLFQADLRSARLESAKLWKANLREVDLTQAQVDASQLATADR